MTGYTYPLILFLKEAFKQNMNSVFQFQNNEHVVVNVPLHHASPTPSLKFKKLMMKIAAYSVCIHSFIPAN